MDEFFKKLGETVIGHMPFGSKNAVFVITQRQNSIAPFLVRGYSNEEVYPAFFACSDLESAKGVLNKIHMILRMNGIIG